jgi:hypothetical protein
MIPRTRGQLTAPADGVGTALNGVYRYGLVDGMPGESWRATDYGVDVLFAP